MAFSYKDYTESDAVKAAKAQADAHANYKESQTVTDSRNAMNTHVNNKVADWTGGTYGDQLNETINKINTRPDFKYDFNADALYQQYKDRYINQGRLAMTDTIGQASAMTGGYGSSYATTAGSQAYQQSLTQLNDVVPQLYQMALDKYNQEGADLQNRYSVLNNAYSTEYGQYRDQVADWQAEADRLTNAYYNEASQDWNKFSSDRDYFQSAYQYLANMDYDQYNDARNVAMNNYQFDAQMALDWAKFNAAQAAASGGGGGSGRSSGGGGGTGAPVSDTSAFDYAVAQAIRTASSEGSIKNTVTKLAQQYNVDPSYAASKSASAQSTVRKNIYKDKYGTSMGI